MIKHLSALLWLRGRILLTNKSILLQIVIAFGFPFLYKFMIKTNSIPHEALIVFLGMSILMILTIGVGTPILAILAEEKEKRTLNTLLVSGVGYSEYILSTLIFPLILTIITAIICPLILGINVLPYILNYCIVVILTGLVIILIYLLLGFMISTQAIAQGVSVLVSLPLIFASMFATFNDTLQKIVNFTPVGLFSQLFNPEITFILSEHKLELTALILWLIIFIVLNRILITKSLEK